MAEEKPTPTASQTASSGAPLAPVLPAASATSEEKSHFIDVAALPDRLASERKTEKFNWRDSIVDDETVGSRQQPGAAQGARQGGASLHWRHHQFGTDERLALHEQVMTKLAENGGKVPDELKH